MNFEQLGIHVKQTELDSPWQNAAEGGIRETKRGSGRKKKSPAQYGINESLLGVGRLYPFPYSN